MEQIPDVVSLGKKIGRKSHRIFPCFYGHVQKTMRNSTLGPRKCQYVILFPLFFGCQKCERTRALVCYKSRIDGIGDPTLVKLIVCVSSRLLIRSIKSKNSTFVIIAEEDNAGLHLFLQKKCSKQNLC